MVTFEPILAGQGETYSQLITLASGPRVLVDMGWDTHLERDLQPVVAALERTDLVLLTHATINHLGAFSYLYKTVPELAKIPIYCTYPVMTLGKLVTTEAYRSAGLAGPFSDPKLTVEDIEESFNTVNLIKYSQSINMARHGFDGLHITGYNSGHSLGGTLWKISSPIDSVLVAYDWNHSKDTHLNGGFLATGGKVNEQLLKPQVLITTANVAKSSLKKSKTEFVENIEKTLRNGGTVLLPTSLTRALELISIVDGMKIKVPLLFVSTIAKKLLEQASTMLEWMVTSIINEWQVKNESPFEASNFKCLSCYDQLDNYKDEAKIIVCTDECLELGFGRQIFADVASSNKNAVLFTQTSAPKTLSAALHELWSAKGLSPINGDLLLKVTSEEPLTGYELEKYNKKVADQEQQAIADAALEKRNQAILEQVEEDSSSDEDEAMQLDHPESGQLGPNILFYGQVFDYTVSSTQGNLQGNPPCQFPYAPNRQKADDYGELIKSGQFQKVEGELDIEMELEAEIPEPVIKKPAVVREKPMKLVSTEGTVKMGCLVSFLDLNGLTDIRSLAMILSQVNPHTTIVIPGNSTKAVQELDPKALVGDIKIEIVSKEQVLDLKLGQKLQDNLKWQQILGDYKVVHATGVIEADPQVDGGRVLNMVPENKSNAGTLFVGEIKLTELKKKLSQEGYRAEFKGPGVLVCNDKVSVHKQGDGNFVIEGGLDEEFYVVRQAIRSFLAQI